ncbi:ferritin-like domain-containing protein [Spirillospora sp. NPDC048911]|uniref:ferritin-like domain-containing protein n=1 Tax=Spirillospora sp. NPDC048911 TaxID=3364527 RepID=UPI0037167801
MTDFGNRAEMVFCTVSPRFEGERSTYGELSRTGNAPKQEDTMPVSTKLTNTDEVLGWRRRFEDAAAARSRTPDPDWTRGARLNSALVHSLQRFQVGEAGDGANLIRKAEQAGDADYSAAARLFIAEEKNHARLLGLLLQAAGAPTITHHWSDAIFVTVRRAMGLRVELLVLMVAELVALRYYQALRDGTDDPLTAEVARRIHADEERHIPFHCDRLRKTSRTVIALWRVLVFGAAIIVAADHGRALGTLGVRRRRFVADILKESGKASALIRSRW